MRHWGTSKLCQERRFISVLTVQLYAVPRAPSRPLVVPIGNYRGLEGVRGGLYDLLSIPVVDYFSGLLFREPILDVSGFPFREPVCIVQKQKSKKKSRLVQKQKSISPKCICRLVRTQKSISPKCICREIGLLTIFYK